MRPKPQASGQKDLKSVLKYIQCVNILTGAPASSRPSLRP